MTVCTIIIGKAGILPQRKEKKIMRKKLMTWLLAFAMIFTVAAPAQAARGGVEDFVRRLYQVVLQREPDAAGLADWCDALTSGRAQGAETAGPQLRCCWQGRLVEAAAGERRDQKLRPVRIPDVAGIR